MKLKTWNMVLKYVFQDWSSNKYSSKGRFILVFYRLASLLNKTKFTKIIFSPLIILYRILFEWVIGIELNINSSIGPGVRLFHGQSIVINGGSIIGKNCLIRNGVTLGTKIDNNGINSKAPILGDNVQIGSNSVIIGPIEIGSNVSIGAGSVVVKSFPKNTIIAGNPAKIISYIK